MAALLLLASLAAHSPALGGAAGCVRLVHPLAAETVVTSGDLAPAACSGPAEAPAFRYDPAIGAARAVHDLTEGEIVAALPASTVPAIRPGETITLAVRVGAVSLSRSVEALQPGRPGQKLFVRGSDGRVFAVDCPEDQQ